MKFIVRGLLLLLSIIPAAAENAAQFNSQAADRFANLALACVHKEYPNHISHTLNGDADVAPPRKLTPAFYGCYDWHSSVHGTGYWCGWSERFPMQSSFLGLAPRCAKA